MSRLLLPVADPAPKPAGVSLLTSALVGDPTGLDDATPGRWTGGFSYQPENQYAGFARDVCDLTTIDLPALAPPRGLAVADSATAGTLTPGASVCYRITALNANGETLACAEVCHTLGGGKTSALVTWNAVPLATSYKVYGRTTAAELFMHTVSATPLVEAGPATYSWVDTGAVTPSGSLPAANTTGGPDTYSNEAVVSYFPFLVVVEDSCSSFGWREHLFRERATRRLDNATPNAIEREFWSGANAQKQGNGNNYLTANGTVGDGIVDLTPGSVPSIARGLQILEDALASTGYGGQGMIHVQPQTVPSLLGARRVGPILYSLLDNIIVPGTGYNGTGPGNSGPAAAGYSWIWATDLVTVWVDDEVDITPDTMAEALDRGNFGEPDTIRFRAQRFAAATWDGYRTFCCKVQLAT